MLGCVGDQLPNTGQKWEEPEKGAQRRAGLTSVWLPAVGVPPCASVWGSRKPWVAGIMSEQLENVGETEPPSKEPQARVLREPRRRLRAAATQLPVAGF